MLTRFARATDRASDGRRAPVARERLGPARGDRHDHRPRCLHAGAELSSLHLAVRSSPTATDPLGRLSCGGG
jgi:hypothetical protein